MEGEGGREGRRKEEIKLLANSLNDHLAVQYWRHFERVPQ